MARAKVQQEAKRKAEEEQAVEARKLHAVAVVGAVTEKLQSYPDAAPDKQAVHKPGEPVPEPAASAPEIQKGVQAANAVTPELESEPELESVSGSAMVERPKIEKEGAAGASS